MVTTRADRRAVGVFEAGSRGVEDGHVVLEEGRKTHRVPLAQIKRAHLGGVEF